MAAPSVSYTGTIISQAENENDGGTWDKWQATQSPTQETDFVYQNTYAISTKVSNATGGVDFDDDAGVDYTAPKATIAKVMITTANIIDTTVAEGMSYQIGSGPSAYYNYYLVGLYAGKYPLTRSWLVVAIDPNEAAWRDATNGSPNLSSVAYYGLYADISAIVKSENVVHDRLDQLTVGSGLTLVGGDGASTDGSFQDFLDADFGTYTNRYGIIYPGQAELVVNGTLEIGHGTATVFTDSNKVVVFPHHRVSEGFCGLRIGMGNSANDVSFTACVFKGLGYVSTKRFFDTSLEVDGALEEITIAAHGWNSGDYVIYSNEGGSDAIGLTNGNGYWVYVVDSDTVALHSTRASAFADTTRVGLTAGAGENHSLIRDPDTRPDYTVVGTTGVGVSWSQCSIDGARLLTLTSSASITGGFILSVGAISASTATISDVSISNATTTEGAALFTGLSTLNNITGCTITAADFGHAFELTTSGTFTSNNTYTGFWTPDDTGWNFHTINGVDAGTEVITTDAAHGFSTGDAVYYNNEGGSDTIGLTNGNKYYVNVASTTTFTVHRTKAAAVAGSSAINLSDGASGETHSLYGAHATIYNNSGGSSTINVTTGSSSPSVRNGTGASTTIAVSVDVTITVKDTDQNPIENVQTAVYRTSDRAEIMNKDTNASGIATEGYSGSTPVEVEVRCRKASSGATKYKNYSSIQTIGTSGLTLTVTLNEDPNNNAIS